MMSIRPILFYELKAKRYCIWAATIQGFLTIHRKATEGHESMPPHTYQLDDFPIWSDPYWNGAEVNRLIERYETDSTFKLLSSDLESHLLSSAADAPEWALDLTDIEIAEAMRLRKLIELIGAAETVKQVQALLKGSAPMRGPEPLKGALMCIAIVCEDYGQYSEQEMLKEIRGYCEYALSQISRYTPGYSAS